MPNLFAAIKPPPIMIKESNAFSSISLTDTGLIEITFFKRRFLLDFQND
jgi:hypothetical protein